MSHSEKSVTLKQAAPTQDLTISGIFASAMKLGHIRRGEYDAGRAQIENHLLLHDMIESGEYKAVVADAIRAGAKLDHIEARDAFLQLAGVSPATYARRQGDIKALGIESVKALRQIGVPYREIRMLAEGPQEIRDEIRKRARTNDITPEYVEVLTSKLIEQTEARMAAAQREREAKHELERADEKLKKVQEKVIVRDEEVRKLQAELREARAGHKTAEEKEIDAIMTRAQNLVKQAGIILGDIDFAASAYARARCVEVVHGLRSTADQIQIENVAAFEEAGA